MNMIDIKIKRIVIPGLLCLALAACAKNKKAGGFAAGNSSDAEAGEKANILDGATEKSAGLSKNSIFDETNVGVKNFSQINKTMSAITGTGSGAVAGVYNDVEPSLPGSNNYSQFSGAMQVAVVKLAGEYCFQTMTNQQRRDAFLGDISDLWNTRLTEAFDSANRQRIISHFSSKIWKHQSNHAKNSDLTGTLNSMWDELVDGRTNNNAETRRLIQATCVVYLSAAPVILM